MAADVVVLIVAKKRKTLSNRIRAATAQHKVFINWSPGKTLPGINLFPVSWAHQGE